MASLFQQTVSQAIDDQPEFVRRKDSLAGGAATVLQVANLLFAANADGPVWVNIILAAVIGVAQIIIHAGTPGAITPSQARRLEVAAEKVYGQSRPSVTPEVEPGPAEYVGEHRADEGDVYDGPSTGA